MKRREAFATLMVLIVTSCLHVAAQIPVPVHGVTVEDTHDIATQSFQTKVITALSNLSVKATTRLVYTPGNAACYYQAATNDIHAVSYIMGQPVDSSEMKCFTPAQYMSRFQDYVTTLGSVVDMWEVGNEINGDWLYGSTKGCQPKATVGSTSQADVMTKMTQAYEYVKAQGGVTELTLYEYPDLNSNCVSNGSTHDMIPWVQANVPSDMKQGLDYVLVSYYNDSCPGSRPEPNWNSVFQQLAAIFPNARLGFGEVGWSKKSNDTTSYITNLVDHFYELSVTAPNYVGGYFYWEFSLDMVPDTKPLWAVINTALQNEP